MNDAASYAVGAVAATLTSFGFVPQAIKMWRTKSAKDVSPAMIIQFIVGVALWVAYGVHLRDGIIIIANFVSLAILVAALLLYFHFTRKDKARD